METKVGCSKKVFERCGPYQIVNSLDRCCHLNKKFIIKLRIPVNPENLFACSIWTLRPISKQLFVHDKAKNEARSRNQYVSHAEIGTSFCNHSFQWRIFPVLNLHLPCRLSVKSPISAGSSKLYFESNLELDTQTARSLVKYATCFPSGLHDTAITIRSTTNLAHDTDVFPPIQEGPRARAE